MFSLLDLDATTACVTAFVVALGLVWVYVMMLARPTNSSREYERLESLLSDSGGKKTVGKTSPGKKEGKKGKGRGKTVVEGSPRAAVSLRKKTTSTEDVMTAEGKREKEEERGGRGEKGGGSGGGNGVTPKTAPSVSAPKKPAVAKPKEGGRQEEEDVDGGGEFQLVTAKSSSRGKKEAPVVSSPSEKDNAPTAKPEKKKVEDIPPKAASAKKGSSTTKTTPKEAVPVLTQITTTTKNDSPATNVHRGENPVVSKVTTKGNTPKTMTSKSDTSTVAVTKESAPVVTKAIKAKQTAAGDRVDDEAKKEQAGVKPDTSPVEEKVKERKAGEVMEEGEWHTQLSRQQLRALKQKEREKAASKQQQPIPEEEPRETPVRGGVGKGGVGRGKGGGEGRGGGWREGPSGQVRRERDREPWKTSVPSKGSNTNDERGVVLGPEASPAVTSSADNHGDSPVAHSNITDLENAIREAAYTSSTSSDDITITSSKTTAVTTSNDAIDVTSDEHDVVENPPSDVVFPSATVTVETAPEGPSDGRGEAVEDSGVESPDVEDWVVLEPPAPT